MNDVSISMSLDKGKGIQLGDIIKTDFGDIYTVKSIRVVTLRKLKRFQRLRDFILRRVIGLAWIEDYTDIECYYELFVSPRE